MHQIHSNNFQRARYQVASNFLSGRRLCSSPRGRASLWLLGLWLLVPATVRADGVDAYLNHQLRELHIPGLAFAVVRDGRVIRTGAYGWANVELGVSTSTGTVFEIGSVTKQFTTAAIMMLVQDGKLGLDDPLNKHLRGVPPAWSRITIRHLLTHSSGIQNYLEVPDLESETFRPGTTHDNIARLFFTKLQLEFEPGETWSYSNSGYLLLGNVIEKVTGQSYWSFLDQRIFKPLKMNATRSSEPSALIPKRAAGYEWNGKSFENRPALHENAYAAGSIVSTVGDMAKWDAALNGEMYLQRSSLAEMWTTLKIRDGSSPPINYGFGWFTDRYHGQRLIQHTGGTPGFSSAFFRFPDNHLTIIILTNRSDRVIDQVAIDLAGMFDSNLARPPMNAKDPDPAGSRRLQETLLNLKAGKVNPDLFTPAMQKFLTTSTGKSVWAWLFADGELQAFRFSEAEDFDGQRTLRYRVVLGGATRWFSFGLTPQNTIARIVWW